MADEDYQAGNNHDNNNHNHDNNNNINNNDNDNYVPSQTRDRSILVPPPPPQTTSRTTGNDDGTTDNPDRGEKLVAPADFDGPTIDRHCTDLLCFILIVVSWIVMTGIGIYAMSNGNINYILRPLDYDGGICGTNFNDRNRTDYPYLLYTNAFAGVCVSSCPNLLGNTDDNLTDVRTLITYGGIYQVSGAELILLPVSTNDNTAGSSSNTGSAKLGYEFAMADYSSSNNSIVCTDDICFPNNSTQDSWTSRGINQGYGFAYYIATTYELLYRCYVTTDASDRIQFLTTGSNSSTSIASNLQQVGAVNDLYAFWNKLYTDLYLARYYIFGFGCGVSTIISLVYIFLMRLPFLLTTVVWTSIFTTILMFVLGGYYAWSQATTWDDANPQIVTDKTIHVTTGFALAMYVIGAILAVLACCLRRAIMEAIVCTKEAGRAVNTMVVILFVPLLQAVGFFLFILPFIFYSANLASLAKITTQNVPVGVDIPGIDDGEAPTIAFRIFEFDDFTENAGWYFLFCFFWTGNFIVAVGDVRFVKYTNIECLYFILCATSLLIQAAHRSLLFFTIHIYS
jgi:Plasma-membrane choline transporter